MTTLDLLKDAAFEIGVGSPGEDLSADDAAFMLGKFNRLLNNWNAERPAVYNSNFTVYTLTPDLQPHTIGPTGATFTVAQRPVSVDGANIVLNDSTPDVRCPLNLRDDTWWLNLAVRDISTTLPTDLYYSPSWPNGSLYLWPVPTLPYGLEIETRVVLSDVTLTTPISLPPGYQDALTLTLAESCASAFGGVSLAALPLVASQALQARARIFANNDQTPRLITEDTGMPRSGARRPYFNWLSGQPM